MKMRTNEQCLPPFMLWPVLLVKQLELKRKQIYKNLHHEMEGRNDRGSTDYIVGT